MSLDAAREAIYGRVVERAASADPDELVKLADAASKVAFGPQGGDTNYRYEADYHNTQHPGEERRAPAGFKPR